MEDQMNTSVLSLLNLDVAVESKSDIQSIGCPIVSEAIALDWCSISLSFMLKCCKAKFLSCTWNIVSDTKSSPIAPLECLSADPPAILSTTLTTESISWTAALNTSGDSDFTCENIDHPHKHVNFISEGKIVVMKG